MQKTLLALAALLTSTSALADTLVTNANGYQVDARGKLEQFTGILIGDDGKVKRLLHGEMLKLGDTNVVDAKGQTVLPGLIDAHGHVMSLGFSALQLDLTGTTSLVGPAPGAVARIKQRIRSETGLTASAGLAPNKFVAKVASDLRKPDSRPWPSVLTRPFGEPIVKTTSPTARLA